MKSNPRISGLIQSGLIYTVINFLAGLGNLAFQVVLQHRLKKTDGLFGSANTVLNMFIPLLSLLPTIALFAVTHYIAHFKACGDEARLQGLLAGCRKFLLYLTILSSLLAMVVIKPLSTMFHYSQSLMLMTLACVVLTLWSSMVAALCQGLSWFKRLALIGFLTMALKFLFGFFLTLRWPTPEMAVLASALGLLANLVLLVWRKELKISAKPVSPWNREFVHYLIISTACIVGGYFFLRGDLMVAQSFFTNVDNDAYNKAEVLGVALPITVAPLLTVLFTSRSSKRSGNIVLQQFKLLGIYILVLLFGFASLYVLRHLLVRIMAGQPVPAAEDMIGRLALTMVFVGLLQAIAVWALSSRWHKISLLYGLLGLTYWQTLSWLGHTPDKLLLVMPITAGAAFVIMFIGWYISMRHRQLVQS
jgi:hypothetical protein